MQVRMFYNFFIIPGELILDDCTYASPGRFWISYSVTHRLHVPSPPTIAAIFIL